MPDLRTTIKEKLIAFSSSELRPASLDLLSTLGYESDKTLHIENASPEAFLEIIPTDKRELFSKDKALFSDWISADLLFQLTDEELSKEQSLFEDTQVNKSLLKSYLFFAIELNGKDAKNGQYARGKLTQIARQINRVFPMPVMVLIKHPDQSRTVVSIAVINRRQNKRDAHKDVLGKVTIIRDISLTDPHRGHLEILNDLALPNLKHPAQKFISNFDTLHFAWEKIFNVELLNKNFYEELANWFFWAKKNCHFPLWKEDADKYDLFHDTDKAREHESKNLIRLLTRTLFVWFIKERNLVPEELFDESELKKSILKSFDSDSKETNYYKAILQNFFFATLNQPQGKREFRKSKQHRLSTNLLRYENRLQDPEALVSLLEKTTPFLNGGLFDCLDRPHPTLKGPQGGVVPIWEDGFSDHKDNPLSVPDFLFFGKEDTVDLSGSDSFGIPAKRQAKVRGLVHILDNYKFTIVENTPIDQEIALDPELLGQVFENLLASYNEETKTTARKQTGSFYTPRPIVDNMVDEALKSHLALALTEKCNMSRENATEKLDALFTYNEEKNTFSTEATNILIEAIDSCKILDPACGSGAFPMGALQKLVYILSKLDPRDELWEQRQLVNMDRVIESAEHIEDVTVRERTIEDALTQKQNIEAAFKNNELGYGRKLFLIKNCLYGVDIQSIATQVTKLRFFISLVVDQTVDITRDNFGVESLPNLEGNFVTANTLISLEKDEAQRELFELTEISTLQQALKRVRARLFSVKTPKAKQNCKKEDEEIREKIATELINNGWDSVVARKLSGWDPYNQNKSETYFDPEWMLGISEFDIVIGNPPYVQIQKFSKAQKDIWVKQKFQTYTATADIYCLFYEKGAQLLKDKGQLVYITMNRWMRAGYGSKLRKFFSSTVNTHSILDFGMAQNFEAATTLTCILQFSNEPYSGSTESCYAVDDRAAMLDPDAYFKEHSVTQKNLNSDAWVVLSKERQEIKSLAEEHGVQLKKWDIHINYGIKTGYNKAFYLDQIDKDKLIKQDPLAENFIVPLLLGRNIERYTTSWDKTWMISTYPALKLTLDQIPKPILKHLEQYLPKLKQTGESFINEEGRKEKTRKKADNQWYETQDTISYYEEFYKTKIIFPEITKWLGFYYDISDNFVPSNKGFIINSETESLTYLTAFFNSHLFRCAFKDNFPELMGNTYEVRKIFIEKIPIKKPTSSEVLLFEKLVPLVQFAKKQDAHGPAQFLENLIDACIMECYFKDHMAERNLLFHDDLTPLIKNYNPDSEEEEQLQDLEQIYKTLNVPKQPIRNRMMRLSTDSPDLLAIILKEGKV